MVNKLHACITKQANKTLSNITSISFHKSKSNIFLGALVALRGFTFLQPFVFLFHDQGYFPLGNYLEITYLPLPPQHFSSLRKLAIPLHITFHEIDTAKETSSEIWVCLKLSQERLRE